MAATTSKLTHTPSFWDILEASENQNFNLQPAVSGNHARSIERTVRELLELTHWEDEVAIERGTFQCVYGEL